MEGWARTEGASLKLPWLLAAGTCQVWKGSSQAETAPSTSKPGSENSWVLASFSTCFEQTKTHSSDGGQQPVVYQGVWARSFPHSLPFVTDVFFRAFYSEQGRSRKHPGESEF